MTNRPEMKKEWDRITDFIIECVDGAPAKGVVLGVSGGIDSAVVLKLCVNAIGCGKVFGLFMPTEFTPPEELADAERLCQDLGVKTQTVYMDPIVDVFLGAAGLGAVGALPRGNLTARARMLVLYLYANTREYLVAGTTDKSEYFLGYYTKWGDGSNDFEPIMHLTKTQTRELGAFLELPKSILERKSSPRLWADHEAEKELGVTYEQIDALLDRNARNVHKRVAIPSLLEE